MKKLLLFAVILFFSVHSIAQGPLRRPDQSVFSASYIDSVVHKLMDTAEVVGLQLGIINQGKPVYVKSYGYARLSERRSNDTGTVFYAASLAKPVFAYLVLRLVEEGLIDLDKPLYNYLPKPLPEYPSYTDLAGDDRWKQLTARHCLDHTTGFPNFRFFNPRNKNKLEFFFTPGTRYAYSGEGLNLLQMVVETITGKGLETLAREKIFQPFHMDRTSFVWQPVFENNFALGYDLNNDPLPKRKRTTAGAAGSMETTIADYMRFVSAVLQRQQLSPKTWNDMLSPQVRIHSRRQFPSLDTATTTANDVIQLSYGLGWGLFNSASGKVFFKEGHDDGWVHYMIAFPGQQMAYLVMCNSSSGESIFRELIERLTGVTIPWNWEGYFPYRATVRLPTETLAQYTGAYEGKWKATISLENGHLRIASADAGLDKTNLYASAADHFFMKTMDVSITFERDGNGVVQQVLVNDEGELVRLKKVP